MDLVYLILDTLSPHRKMLKLLLPSSGKRCSGGLVSPCTLPSPPIIVHWVPRNSANVGASDGNKSIGKIDMPISRVLTGGVEVFEVDTIALEVLQDLFRSLRVGDEAAGSIGTGVDGVCSVRLGI